MSPSCAFLLVMREYAIDDKSVERDDHNRKEERYGDEEGDWDSLVHGVGILKGIISKGEVLMEGFDPVEGIEATSEKSVIDELVLVEEGRRSCAVFGREETPLQYDQVVKDIPSH